MFDRYGLPADRLQSGGQGLWVWQDGAFTAADRYSAVLGDAAVTASPGSVLVDGAEISYRRAGLDVVVLSADGSWRHAATWAAEHGFAYYTA